MSSLLPKKISPVTRMLDFNCVFGEEEVGAVRSSVLCIQCFNMMYGGTTRAYNVHYLTVCRLI